MNPTLAEVLNGNLAALSEPAGEDSAGDFAVGRVTVVGLLSFLCAQEAERGAAVRHAENEAIRALFKEAVEGGWTKGQSGDLARLAETRDEDLSLTGLDAANAALRTALIDLQIAVEDSGDIARQRQILQLLVDSARARRLTLPGEPASP